MERYANSIIRKLSYRISILWILALFVAISATAQSPPIDQYLMDGTIRINTIGQTDNRKVGMEQGCMTFLGVPITAGGISQRDILNHLQEEDLPENIGDYELRSENYFLDLFKNANNFIRITTHIYWQNSDGSAEPRPDQEYLFVLSNPEVTDPTHYRFKINLTQPDSINEAWINRMTQIIGLAQENNVIVQLDFFCKSSLIPPIDDTEARLKMRWPTNPYHLNNYFSDIPENSGLDNSWFYLNDQVREVTHSYINKVISSIHNSPGGDWNVIYSIMNETSNEDDGCKFEQAKVTEVRAQTTNAIAINWFDQSNPAGKPSPTPSVYPNYFTNSNGNNADFVSIHANQWGDSYKFNEIIDKGRAGIISTDTWGDERDGPWHVKSCAYNAFVKRLSFENEAGNTSPDILGCMRSIRNLAMTDLLDIPNTGFILNKKIGGEFDAHQYVPPEYEGEHNENQKNPGTKPEIVYSHDETAEIAFRYATPGEPNGNWPFDPSQYQLYCAIAIPPILDTYCVYKENNELQATYIQSAEDLRSFDSFPLANENRNEGFNISLALNQQNPNEEWLIPDGQYMFISAFLNLTNPDSTNPIVLPYTRESYQYGPHPDWANANIGLTSFWVGNPSSTSESPQDQLLRLLGMYEPDFTAPINLRAIKDESDNYTLYWDMYNPEPRIPYQVFHWISDGGWVFYEETEDSEYYLGGTRFGIYKVRQGGHGPFSESVFISDGYGTPGLSQKKALNIAINLDRRLDVIVDDDNGRCRMMTQDRQNRFEYSGLEFDCKVDDITVSDLNHDGHLDLVYPCSGTIQVEMNRNSRFEPSRQIFPENCVDFLVKDLNNDTYSDLIVAQINMIKIYQNDSQGIFQLLQEVPTQGVIKGLDAGDIYGNNLTEIIAATTAGTEILKYDPSDGYIQDETLNSGDTKDVAVKDLNGDQKSEIVTGSEDGDNVVWTKDELSDQAIDVSSVETDGTSKISIEDRDGDKKLDIVVSTAEEDKEVFLNNGDLTFSESE